MPNGLGPAAEAAEEAEEADDADVDVTAEYGVAGVQGVAGVDGHLRLLGRSKWLRDSVGWGENIGEVAALLDEISDVVEAV